MLGASSGTSDAFGLAGVSRRFGEVEALVPTTLRIAAGERVALVGPSGSGKSTLLRILNASLPATGGDVSVNGSSTRQLSTGGLRRMRAKIATIPQSLGLVPNLRVWQNVATGRIGQRGFFGTLKDLFLLSKASLLEIHTLLERVGIEEKLYARTSQLSGGQQQRVAVARALFQNPEAILADEPVSSVDPARAASLVKLLNELAEERGLTLVMSLHNLDLAREHFPRLIGLRSGKVTFDAAPGSVADSDLESLYDLGEEELLEDGVGN